MRAALIAAASVAIALGSAGSAFAQPSLSWHGAGAPAPGLAGVSCPSFGLCVAVAGASAYVNSAPTTGTTWTPEATDAGHTLNAISCAPGSTVCVAVGDSGAISETQNGTTWTAKSAAGESSDLTGVACPSASFCIAVDAGGDAIVSTNGGASWGSPVAIDAANDLTGVACVSSAFCAAVDSEGDIVDSSTPASPGWSLAASDGASGGLTGVACAATGSCVAIDAAGYAWASANPTSATATWSATHVAGALAAVACTAAAACVASDAGTVARRRSRLGVRHLGPFPLHRRSGATRAEDRINKRPRRSHGNCPCRKAFGELTLANADRRPWVPALRTECPILRTPFARSVGFLADLRPAESPDARPA